MLRPLTRLMMLATVLGLTACGAGGPTAADDPCAPASPGQGAGPVVLQSPSPDGSGAGSVRTDGPCAVLVAFTGAPPDRVASYGARLEAVGDDLRLVVEPLDDAGEPAPATSSGRASGAYRTARAELDVPLDDRRVVDEQGRAVLLLDGDRLLRPGRLPDGWSAGQERPGGGSYVWQQGLGGPGRLLATLFQGGPEAGRVLVGEGHREAARPQVRGQDGVLAVSDLSQWTLNWTDGDRGYLLQLRGEVDDPGALLVELADGLV